MARLEIDTKAIRKNFSFYRDNCGGSIVIPVIKDNAYGLGAEKVMSELHSVGARLFACATPSEALACRRLGYDVLLLSCTHLRDEAEELVRTGVILAVESYEQAVMINSFGILARVHIAVDTGFGRFGFMPRETYDIKNIFSLPNIKVCGIFTHIRNPLSSSVQKRRFDEVLWELSSFKLGLRHMAASSTALNKNLRYDAVRIGSGLTGRVNGEISDSLICASKLTAGICNIRSHSKGSRVGYNGKKLKRDTTVAVIDAGISDGAFVRRNLSIFKCMTEFDEVDVSGIPAPLISSPGLTHCAVDITNIPCRIGDRVVIDQTPVLVPGNVLRVYY